MKTSVIEVHDMLSVLSVDGVEQRIGAVPGVESVTVNFAAASATVRYDETRLDIADIKSGVRQSGFEVAAADAAAKHPGHEGHGASSTPSPLPAPPAPAATTGAAGASTMPRDNAAPAKSPATVPAPTAQDDNAQRDKDKH